MIYWTIAAIIIGLMFNPTLGIYVFLVGVAITLEIWWCKKHSPPAPIDGAAILGRYLRTHTRNDATGEWMPNQE